MFFVGHLSACSYYVRLRKGNCYCQGGYNMAAEGNNREWQLMRLNDSTGENADLTVWGVHLSDAGTLTKKEREELLFKLSRLLTFVGTEIPEEAELDGQHIPLREVMWQLINHKQELTPDEFAAVDTLYGAIERKIREIEATIKTGDIGDDEALALYAEAQGLICAAVELRDIEKGKKLNNYARAVSEKTIEAQKRWLEYLKKIR